MVEISSLLWLAFFGGIGFIMGCATTAAVSNSQFMLGFNERKKLELEQDHEKEMLMLREGMQTREESHERLLDSHSAFDG